MKSTSTTNRTEYYKISSFIFLYFFTWSASIGLLAIWLGQKANLSGSVIGTVFAVNGIFSVILKPIYGYILDKIGMSKYLLYFVVIMSALMAPFFIYVYQPLLMSNTLLGIIIGALYLSFAWYAGVAACESYSDRFSRLNGMEFGQIRMWGSLGWAVASSFSGLLFNLSPAYNFILGSVASVMMFIAEQQFSRYFVTFFDDIHEGNAVFGYLGTVQSGMEFVMYMVVPLFVNFIGAKRGLLIVGLVVGARLIISGMCDSHLLISVLKPLYGLEICLLLVSVFKYIAEHFDKRVNATMYLLGYQAMLYVGNVVVSSPAGYMYDRIGFEHTYIIMGATALTFTLISAFTLSACQSKWRGARALNVAETSTR